MMCIFNIISVVLLTFFVCFDVLYYIRMVCTVFYGRLFEKTGKVTDPTVTYGFCFTQDIDIAWKHMNNARFVRNLDFARYHFYDRSGIYDELVKRKSIALQTATNISYRKAIPIFSFYKITTQIIYLDEKNIYIEQKFITNDDFIQAIVLSKKKIVDETNFDDVMKSLHAGPKPEISRDLGLWIQSMEVSSEKLRPRKI